MLGVVLNIFILPFYDVCNVNLLILMLIIHNILQNILNCVACRTLSGIDSLTLLNRKSGRLVIRSMALNIVLILLALNNYIDKLLQSADVGTIKFAFVCDIIVNLSYFITNMNHSYYFCMILTNRPLPGKRQTFAVYRWPYKN